MQVASKEIKYKERCRK